MTDVVRLLTNCQRDVRALSVKLTELQAHLAAMSLPVELSAADFTCRAPGCALGFRSAERLSEHVYNVHGGPLPSHWQEPPHPAVPWVPVHVHEGDR